MKSVKPPFGYFGAKHRIAKQIVKTLPPHYVWVEAFCGSAAVTLAKAPAPIEIINDIDDQIINLFEQLRNNQKALCEAIALTPYARSEYFLSKSDNNNISNLEKARRFLVATMMTINGAIGGKTAGFSFSQSYTRNRREARVNRWYNLPDRLAEVAERLRSIRIENRDGREIVKMFIDRPATLIYLDPPYFINRKQKYNFDAIDENFHIELLELCCKSKSMILISGYDNDLYNSILTTHNGWMKTAMSTTTRDTNGKDFLRTEIIWKNKKFIKALETGKVPIRLSKKERTMNKLNPPR